jgi:recombination associated protein RdgC
MNPVARPEDMADKTFLGMEFLTWLWFASEQEDPPRLPDGRPVGILIGERMVLGPGPGREGARVTIRGPEADPPEARQALKRGKLVEVLRLGLELEGEEFWLTLEARTLGVASLKLPPTMPPLEAGGNLQTDATGGLLERVALISQALEAVEGLFTTFLRWRLENPGELARGMRAWVAQR